MHLGSFIEKCRYKLKRRRYPRPLRHMTGLHPDFFLRSSLERPGFREIVWKGSVVGVVRPTQELRNSSSGDCFIVCSGPSLSEIDLSAVSHFSTIAVNGATRAFHDRDLQPAYWTATDPDFFKHRFDLVRRGLTSKAICLLSAEGLSEICIRDPSLLAMSTIYLSELLNHRYYQPRMSSAELTEAIKRNPQLHGHATQPSRDDAIGFSCDLSLGLFCGRTIAYRAIQIGYYIGYRRMFIIGMDLAAPSARPRFYNEGGDPRPTLLDQDYKQYIEPCFEVLHDLCEARLVDVYNLSPHSRLPAALIPKLTMQEAFQRVVMKRIA